MPEVEALKMPARLQAGISLGESHFREFKSAIDRKPPKPKARDVKFLCRDVAETLVAFANADGGELYIGVEDEGTITGVPHEDAQIQMVLEATRSHVHSRTPLPGPTIARVSIDGKIVLYLQTAKSTSHVHLTCDGRCLQRFDKENRIIPPEEIQYNRQEQKSREYDRSFVDGASLLDLNWDLVEKVSRRIAGGQTPEMFLQYMDLGEYGPEGLRLRRAALLLFAKEIVKWQPRCEVRIMRVSGTALGVGQDYNIDRRDDHTVRGNILEILESAWDTLRPFLARTKPVERIFQENLIYPQDACGEALTNAVAHRDYSIDGKGIEVLIFDDRLEVKSPGGLLSSISIDDLRTGKRTHQSRNVYVARILRELGFMREMEEGMLVIFSTMKDRDLVAPELNADATKFDLVLHHRSVFSPKDQEWLRAYALYGLSRDEQRIVLLGRDGHLLSTNEIMRTLSIINTDDFRQLVETLRKKGILYTALEKRFKGAALRDTGKWREVGRFAIRPPDQTEQYRRELMKVLQGLGQRSKLIPTHLEKVQTQLSSSSPYREQLQESLKLLGLVDERMRPLPSLAEQWQVPGSTPSQPAGNGTKRPDPALRGKISTLKPTDKYGFIHTLDGQSYFFHLSDLVDRKEWDVLRTGMLVTFESAGVLIPGKNPSAKNVRKANVRQARRRY